MALEFHPSIARAAVMSTGEWSTEMGKEERKRDTFRLRLRRAPKKRPLTLKLGQRVVRDSGVAKEVMGWMKTLGPRSPEEAEKLQSSSNSSAADILLACLFKTELMLL
ncbi:hypothetical protein J437_LFUL015632 [Ladona fulva]|uniref:Uncharacterized protein n=1 Tax=Ladona fulva TaxID=123851 RepID=A0A8K0KJ72_LADFU|nr:hypothetical protein J437_LFUL015632 [Ladona fulva]